MDNSKVLGFYYMVFQTQFNGYVKCWIDGEEDYNLYTEQELLNLAAKLNNSYPIRRKISDALIESSFFLWDVDADEVTRISPKHNLESVRENLIKARFTSTQQSLEPVTNHKGLISLIKDKLSGLY